MPFSPGIVQTAVWEALMKTGDGGLPSYLPYGAPHGSERQFDVTDTPPKKPADLIDNRGRVTIELTPNGKTPNYDTHGTVVLKFTAFAKEKIDAQWLAEAVFNWLPTVTEKEMPMLGGQQSTWINLGSMPAATYINKYEIAAATFLATVHISVRE